MTLSTYRISIALILTTLSGVGVFVLASETDTNIIDVIREVIAANISSGSSTPIASATVPSIHIEIEKIISERYLDTLNRVVTTKLIQSIGTGVTLEGAYANYRDITLEGSDFVFHFGSNDPIHIATSSFFFDRYHARDLPTVSGEMIRASKKVIALTFDDGPSELYTNTLLDILQKEGVHATFYVLGRNAEKYPAIIKREHDEGHEIGNHSYSHTAFTKLGSGQIRDELFATDQAIYLAIGEYPRTFRPPYGATNTGILADIAMPFALWSIDTRDWQTHSVVRNISGVSHAKNGDILIMHDIHETSVASIPAIIAKLRAQGFTFVTVSELLGLSPDNQEIGKRCYKKGDCR